jgi:hypothetical protein
VLKHEIPIKTVNAYSKVPQKSKASSNISEFEDLEAVPPMAESCREVEAIISFLKPQFVFLELCSSCVTVLAPQNINAPTMGQMVEIWKKQHDVVGILYSWFLAKVARTLF